MYDGERLNNTKLIIDSPDSKETLDDAKESRLKMKNKMIQLNYENLMVFMKHLFLNKNLLLNKLIFQLLLLLMYLLNEAILALRKNIDVTLLEDSKRSMIYDGQNTLRKFYKTYVIPMSLSLIKCSKELKQELTEEVAKLSTLPYDVKKVIQLIFWIVDSGCSKHMTGNLQLLRNFIEKFMGIVLFGNDHFIAITGYGDYGEDLLTDSRDSNLYNISISELASSSPVCLISKATSTKSWLWQRRLSHLNFGTINHLMKKNLVDGLPKFKYDKDHLCSTREQRKSKKASFPPKLVPSTNSKLELIHIDLCGPMRVASINGKRYILVIVDDYSRYTWLFFLHTKDEAPDIIINFITQIQQSLQAQILKVRSDNGTKFKNEKLQTFYAKLSITHNTSTIRTPQQNSDVERRNRTLVEAARTMLIFLKTPEFIWDEAIATACFT
ncbi:retrovirus-related pol polyprotein from transposon TNT 1-94 [Tanacetum coccineum]